MTEPRTRHRRADRRWLATIGLLALAALAAAVPAGAKDRHQAIDTLFRTAYEADRRGGLTVGVVADGRLVWTRSYGFADEGARRRAARRTVYRIGSITKQFTAITYLRLLQQGLVKGDDRAAALYPPLLQVQGDRAAIEAITLDALATHRSGLAREPAKPGFVVGPLARWEDTLQQALASTRLAYPPFGEPQYSNIGFAVLGAAIARRAGTDYVTLVERDVLRPLHLRHTAFDPTPAMRRNLARGYEPAAGGSDPTDADTELRDGRGYKIPNGGLFTTVDDLARFVAFEIDGAPGVLSRDVLDDNRRHLFGKPGEAYGRGFYQWKGFVGHGGRVGGFSSSAYFDPTRRVGIICLRNFGDNLCGSDLIAKALTLAGNDGR